MTKEEADDLIKKYSVFKDGVSVRYDAQILTLKRVYRIKLVENDETSYVVRADIAFGPFQVMTVPFEPHLFFLLPE